MNELEILGFGEIFREKFNYPTYTHNTWVLYVVIEGSFRCTLSDKTETVKKNELYFIPPNKTVKRKVIEPLRTYHISFNLNTNSPLENMFPIGLFHPSNVQRLNENIQILTSLSKSPLTTRRVIRNNYILDIIYSAVYEMFSQKNRSLFEEHNSIGNLIEYMNNNYMNPITMQDIADKFNLSPSGLIYKFKKELGILPLQYLTNIRIKEAKKLLSTSLLNLADIAEMTGFENQYYFSRVFKQQTGIPPSEYRKKYDNI